MSSHARNRPGPEEWTRVIEGDRAALDRLFAEWMPVVLQWCRRLGGDRVDADQAAQEVFIVVLRRVHTVRSPGQFPRWAFAVTRRVLAQHRRRAWGRRWDSEASTDHAAGGSDPELSADRSERVRRLRAALDALPEPLREAVVLCDLEERTDPEAAELLGIPTGTLKSRLRRGRAQLRHSLTLPETDSPQGSSERFA